ncbi:MAG: hypothetical protein ACTHQ3_08215, partial [Motilibacteraceae bacterium]
MRTSALPRLALAVVVSGALVAALAVPWLLVTGSLAGGLPGRLGGANGTEAAVVDQALPGNTRVLAADGSL